MRTFQNLTTDNELERVGLTDKTKKTTSLGIATTK